MTRACFLIALASSLALLPAGSRADTLESADNGALGASPYTLAASAAPSARPAQDHLADAGELDSGVEVHPLSNELKLLPAASMLQSRDRSPPLDNQLTEPLPVGDSGDAYDDLWDRIRDNFSMTTEDGARVTQQVEWFEAHPDYVQRLTERARRYLYYIVDEVEKRGMPGEVALLPIVESAFNPRALSSTKAAGMWQFMPATGKLYGMRQNWWYDARRDVVAATNGALDYLDKLHTQFGSWDLALAAYNCGEGTVAHAIERNRRDGRPTDYASLTLPEETRDYVPKLLAAREVVSDPEAHGLSLANIPDEPYFTVVTTTRHIDLAVAARFARLPVSEFLALNPGYNRPLILAQGEQHILVPATVAEAFTARLNDPDAHLVSWRPHRLRRGESLASVASRYGMSSEEFKRVNGIAARRVVAGGGTVLVRDAMADEGDLEGFSGNAASEAELAPPMETVTFSHRVRRGESLASIARRYSVGVASLRSWNRIPRTRGARLGQLLIMHRTGEMGQPELKAGLRDATVVASSSSAKAPLRARSTASAARSRHGALMAVAQDPGKRRGKGYGKTARPASAKAVGTHAGKARHGKAGRQH